MSSEYTPGSTGWDVLLRSSDGIRKLLTLLFVFLGIWLAFKYLESEAIEALLVGGILGWVLTSYLTKPTGRLVLVVPTDLIDGRIRLVWIPEEHYQKFNTCGNGLAITSMMGTPLYIAKDLDLEKHTIDYSWVHESNICQVYAYESILRDFLNDAQAAMVDNLAISQYPKLWGAKLAKEPVQFVSDQFGRLAGFSPVNDDVNIVDLANLANKTREVVPE